MNVNLILDRIFCHVIHGGLKYTGYPDPWHACLMVTLPSAAVPRFLRIVLRTCTVFSLKRPDVPLAVGLVRAWLSVYSISELPLDPSALLVRALADGPHPLEVLDLIMNQKRLAVSADMVDAASRAGVPALERLWYWHHIQQHHHTAFPYSVKAVDNALDVATLAWWWHRHTNHDLPFMYDEAVHLALTARMLFEQTQQWAIKPPSPYHLAMCRWWRDRAMVDGLALRVHFDDFDTFVRSKKRAGECPRTFNIEDLVMLGYHGLHETLATWADMVDQGLIGPVSMVHGNNRSDPLLTGKLFDGPVLEWWLYRHCTHGLPFPPIAALLANASKHGRIDTLEWIWAKSILVPERIRFTVPKQIEVNRTTVTPVTEWWRAHCNTLDSDMPLLVWDPSDSDTCYELQAFWDLQYSSTRIAFTNLSRSGDVHVLAWLCDHARQEGGATLQISSHASFELAWHTRRFDTLDYLVARQAEADRAHSGTGPTTGPHETDTAFVFTLRRWLLEAATTGDLEFLSWWHRHPYLHAKAERTLAIRVLAPALANGQREFASRWYAMTRELALVPFTTAQLAERLCFDGAPSLATLVAGFKWMVVKMPSEDGGGVKIAAHTLADLVMDSDTYESMRLLEWLAADAPAMGVTVEEEAPGAPETEEQWDQIRRVARLSYL
ncbi:hypothetical protein BC828DRAFT_391774 [Blastocladiella britannica]|nr:hypothetical protein BC828DRAFT_391774 [Blastocladiella britannica]